MVDDIFIPTDRDVDIEAEAQMRQGKDTDNDLRDPWFTTNTG